MILNFLKQKKIIGIGIFVICLFCGGCKKEETVTLQSITPQQFYSYQEEKDTFGLVVNAKDCAFCDSFLPVVEEFVQSKQLDFYQIDYEELMTSNDILTREITGAPSVLLVKDGSVVAILSPTKDEDKKYYENAKSFSTWLSQYVDVTIVEGSATSSGMDDGCAVFDNGCD